MRNPIKHILFWFLTMMTCLAMTLPSLHASAQTPIEPESMMVSDDQAEAWFGQKTALNHPVVPHLKYEEKESLHFYYEIAYERRAQAVIHSASSARHKNLRFLPSETLNDIHIYLLANMNTYFREQKVPERAPAWASGLSILRDDVILIRLQSVGITPIEPERTLAHELNHVALRRFTGSAYIPHWFYEGLAMLSTEDWGIKRAETLTHASMSGQLLDLPAIEAAFGKTGAIVDLAYAESAHFVAWLAQTHGDEAIKNLILALADGQKFDDAFLEIFDHTPNASFAIWYENMSKNESRLFTLFSGDAIFFYVSLFAALALVIALIRRRRSRKERLQNMSANISVNTLPENLRHFGPFMNK